MIEGYCIIYPTIVLDSFFATSIYMLLAGWKGKTVAFSSLRSQFSTIQTIQTDPKLVNSMFVFFPAVNWLASGFAYATLLLYWVMRRLQAIHKKSNEQTGE